MTNQLTGRLMRRLALFLTVFLTLLVACSPDSRSDDSAPADDADSSATPAEPAPPREDRPSIDIASSFLPGSLDPAQEGYSLIQRGAGETLTRVGHGQAIEPWLAESVELVEGSLWEIVLRDDVTFWDGEPLTSERVIDSFERSWAEQPAASGFLSEESGLEVVDQLTLRITLPEPDSGLAHNLAAPQLVIHKMNGNEAVMTGPYRPTALRVDDELVLEAFDDYWGGLPPLEQLTIKRVPDGNARALAVQAGDVDIITEASPDDSAMASGDIESQTVDSTRVHYMTLNHEQAPFSDPAVREAVDLAIDRDELNEVALGGVGGPVSTLIPPGIGIETPPQLGLDVAAAETILDDAGWTMTDTGVRMKDGEALEFQLYSYTGRPELTPMAVSIQDQLGRIGIEVAVQEVDDVVGVIEGGDFQAAMFSLNMLPTGDPFYALQSLGAADGGSNYGNYENEEFGSLLREIRLAQSRESRAEYVVDAQQTLQDDHVAIFLMSSPRSVIYRPDQMSLPDLHPSEMYFIHTDLPVPVS